MVSRILSYPWPVFLIVIPQMSGGKSERFWKSVGDALEANHCLRSLHVRQISLKGFHTPHELSVLIEGLCRNERLTELTIITNDLRGIYMRVSET